ncbi:hypothetical protein DB347_17740 [Opitutaceae bacterium EW11]|nr:hypothetical protein DB347_17740 [Opitutaceae bacterium EW11]
MKDTYTDATQLELAISVHDSTPQVSHAPRANYRIYDETGSGVTEDIYAKDLSEAIRKGREWIEGGDWGDDIGRREIVTIDLPCCVREIVRDEDGQIDEDATDDGEEWDCSGTYKSEAPRGTECCGGEHDWCAPQHVVGGCDSNPGCWSQGGTSMLFRRVCRNCGRYSETTYAGSQRNYGEPTEVEEVLDRDEDSEAWIREQHADDDGYLPEWLAEELGDNESTRGQIEEAVEELETEAKEFPKLLKRIKAIEWNSLSRDQAVDELEGIRERLEELKRRSDEKRTTNPAVAICLAGSHEPNLN